MDLFVAHTALGFPFSLLFSASPNFPLSRVGFIAMYLVMANSPLSIFIKTTRITLLQCSALAKTRLLWSFFDSILLSTGKL